MIKGVCTAVVLAGLVLAAGQAAAQDGQAEVPRGLWETAPDRSGVVLHVRTRRCGRALCGRVERAKNKRGYDTPSDVVGEKLLWDLSPQADGSFLGEYRPGNGEVFERTRIEVRGRKMRLEACNAETCLPLEWQRIR